MKNIKTNIWIPVVLLPVWYIIYHYLQPGTNWLIDSVFGMTKGAHLTEAIRFFVFEFPKVMMLLTLIIFFVGIIRTYFTPERTRKALEGKKTFTGNVMASALGIVTPFCSCSAIPLFLGFVESGVPLGVTFSFLISSPMINEVAVILLYGMFGWKVAAIYVGTGLVIAIIAGWVIGLLKLEKWVEPWVYETHLGNNGEEEEKITFGNRISLGYDAIKDIVGKVWIYVALGIAVGAGAHGYVPEEFMAVVNGQIGMVLSTSINFNWYSSIFQCSRYCSNCICTY